MTVTSIRRVPEIPCEYCGQPRTFLGEVQWCDNCGWNLDSAVAKLRFRARVMAALGAVVLVGDVLLWWAAPIAGAIWLPLAIFLAAALILYSQRDYRAVRAASRTLHSYPRSVASHELANSRLQNLKVELRYAAWLVFAGGIVILLGVSLLPLPQGTLIDRCLPLVFLLGGGLLFGRVLLKEHRIVKRYAATLARITAFERAGRNSRVALYEYESVDGKKLSGKGGTLIGFAVGMSVPVLYNSACVTESLPIPAFLFYRIRSELE